VRKCIQKAAANGISVLLLPGAAAQRVLMNKTHKTRASAAQTTSRNFLVSVNVIGNIAFDSLIRANITAGRSPSAGRQGEAPRGTHCHKANITCHRRRRRPTTSSLAYYPSISLFRSLSKPTCKTSTSPTLTINFKS